ncbi:MAG TPA: hypothetical protein VNZ56_15750 [Verrucomicrobiae bacterium]|jgi:hypothetical protein|nr:hypothetical protein [Verrucomicrobiae bacterium]
MTTEKDRLRDTHHKVAAFHTAMAKGDTEKASECLESMSDDEHATMAEHHLQCCRDLDADGEHAGKVEKGMHNEQDRIVPDRVHRINPTDGLRLAPRTGAPTAPQTPKVAPGLEKFVAVNEE